MIRIAKQIYDIKLNIMENTNSDIIIDIENKCLNGHVLKESLIDYFLSYVCFVVRCEMAKLKKVSLKTYDFKDDKNITIGSLADYFRNLRIKHKIIDIANIVGGNSHLFMIAYFNDELIYIVDPTYNQFFDIAKCNKSCFKQSENGYIKKPDPGYFILNSSLGNQEIIKRFLQNGYMVLNEKNAKIYGDSFKSASIDSNEYSEMSGSLYIKSFKRCEEVNLEIENILIHPKTSVFYKKIV